MADQASGTPERDVVTSADVSAEVEERAQAYWRTNLTVIGILLTIWALVSYGFGYLLANPLSGVTIGSVQFGFWWAQQGAIIVFIFLILAYALIMERVDQKFDVHE